MNKVNIFNKNEGLARVVDHVADWHHTRNVIDGATDLSQCEKLMEEFAELVAATLSRTHNQEYNADEVALHMIAMITSLHTRGKLPEGSTANAYAEQMDALGDMTVVMLNIMERNQMVFEDVLQGAYAEIKDRKGMMLKGTFVKAKDLPLYRDEIERLGFHYESTLKDFGVKIDSTDT